MVKAQEWLDSNYPCNCDKNKKDRYERLIHQKNCSQKNIKELDLRNLNLEGELDLKRFSDSLKIYLAENPQLGKIKNKSSGTIFIYQNLREFFSKYYPNKDQVERINLSFLGFEQPSELILDNYPNLKEIFGYDIPNLTKVTISSCPQLEKVDIDGFKDNKELFLNNLPNLNHLDCRSNQLITLDLSNCHNLQKINCSYNLLTEIKLPNPAKKLEELYLFNNNLSQDLSFLKNFVNLKVLKLGDNNFKGSLESLKNMSRLENLNISYTDIDSGLEYLPESIKEFNCWVNEKDAKVKSIAKFSQKLKDYKQWRKFAFAEEEIKEWIEIGFRPEDADYAKQWSLKFTIEQTKEWIELGFGSNELDKLQKWEENEFNYEEIKEWIGAEAKKDDYKFIAWLKNTKKETPQWITNYKEDYQILSKRFERYGLCLECSQPNTGDKWCQNCNSKRLKQNFQNWTSKNPQIDQFIQEYQLAATGKDKFVEWIPHKQFKDIEYLAEGGFGKVYKAKWNEGNISHWDTKSKKWQREKDYYYKEKAKNKWDFKQNPDKYKKPKNHREVVLKSLNNSKNSIDFLDETAKHKIIDDWFNNIVPCYGLSQNPKTGNYLMVMQYMPEGNLRNYLKNKNKELSIRSKIEQLLHIAQGLKDIHAKNLVHRDFHSGNILKGIERAGCLITDLGLCKPANEISKEDKIFGVMPYVAPEVLRSQPYTQTADVYSFGIISYEALSGLTPYYDKKHDEFLGMQICQGLRPEFNIKIPILLEDLVKKCWDNDPSKRPTANELERTLRKWQEELDTLEKSYSRDKKNTEFTQQLQEAEEYNKTLPDHVKYPDYKKKMHEGAIYTSRLLPTKEITQLLKTSHLQNKTSELSKQLIIKFNKLSEEIKQEPKNLKKTSELIYKFLEKSKELTKELEEIIAFNPDISEEGKEALEKIKKLKDELKSQSNSLLEENNIFEEQKKEIDYLEARVQELTKLIKQKKEKIVSIFKRLLPDKKKELELIQNLVIAHLEYTKAKKQSLSSVPLRRQRDEIRDELEELLGNSLEEEIESSLNDCEELVAWELELEEKFSKKSSLIKEQKQILQIIGKSKESKILELEFQVVKQEENNQKQLQEEMSASNYFRNRLGKVEEFFQGKLIEEQPKVDSSWTSIHPNFTEEQIQAWQRHNFTPQQTQDWINIHSPEQQIQAIQEPDFYAWLRNEIKLTPSEALNELTPEEVQNLRERFQESHQTPQIIHNPKNN